MLYSRKIIVVFLVFLVFLSTVSFAMVEPTTYFYANDYANLISSQLESYIINKNVELNERTGAQIVVVTIPSLEGKSLEEYATQLFRKFGIGDRNKNNGVLLLLALEERQFRIEVGYGLEGRLNDAKTGRIQDEYIIPYLKNNNWEDGIENGFNAIYNEVCEEYKVDSGIEKLENNYRLESYKLRDKYIALVICSMTLGLILRIAGRPIATKLKKNPVTFICTVIAVYMGIINIILFFVERLDVNNIGTINVTTLIMIATGLFAGGRNIRRWKILWWRWRRFFWRWRKLRWRRKFERFLNEYLLKYHITYVVLFL